RLTDWSRDLYPAWIGDLRAASGIDPEYRTCGMLVLPPYDRAAALAWAGVSGEPVQELSARSILPALAVDDPALWMSRVAQVRNPRLLQALRLALLRHDVQILEQTALTGWCSTPTRIEAINTAQGAIAADEFVLAAGAWSRELLGEQGADIPIKPVRGQIVLYKSEPGRLKQVVYRDGLYIIPRDDGHLLVGSTLEEVGFDKNVTEAARIDLSQRAAALLPFLEQKLVVGHWAGLRPGSPENIPIMARHPSIENLYLSSGHYRYGVTMAPASSQLMANLILGHPNPIDVSPYRWPT
ncbi:MAG: FAD-dependent oxidoreductase, partial [Burkholderiales bacterium]|nr:FAD-dependent oxidoreductase [Burkholderiales bacterium]